MAVSPYGIMKNNILIWIALVIVALGIWLVIPVTFWQYLFFLRIPLVMGILLLALPAIAEFILPELLQNLFVLRGIWQIAFTMV